MRIIVDLPAPLGPKNPTISPLSMVKLTLFSAICFPKFLVMFSTEMDIQNQFAIKNRTIIALYKSPSRNVRNSNFTELP